MIPAISNYLQHAKDCTYRQNQRTCCEHPTKSYDFRNSLKIFISIQSLRLSCHFLPQVWSITYGPYRIVVFPPRYIIQRFSRAYRWSTRTNLWYMADSLRLVLSEQNQNLQYILYKRTKNFPLRRKTDSLVQLKLLKETEVITEALEVFSTPLSFFSQNHNRDFSE